MKITPTDADYTQACLRVALVKWSDIKARAKQVAAERILKENQRCVDELIKQLPGLTNREHWRVHEQIDRIWDQQDDLMRVAYPSSYETRKSET